MPQIRRSVYAFFHRYDAPVLHPLDLLRGDVEIKRLPQLLAISILRGAEFEISKDEFAFLSELPSDRWVDVEELPSEQRESVSKLAELGLVLSTDDDPVLAELRRKDEQLAQGQWNIYAALLHSLTTWRDIDLSRHFGENGELPVPPEGAAAAFVERHGEPPPHFHRVERAGPSVPLPLIERDDGLFGSLHKRKTTRAFDRDAEVTMNELGIVLREVFGCRGLAPIADGVAAMKKTSPSGGSLHPIEAYILVRRIEGLDPGLYHYRTDNHALAPLETMTAEEAENLAVQFTCGQTYFATAGALVVLAARFRRSFWKYRKHQRAYGVLLLEAGHLSQTLYLVCAELGLAAFVTAAINGANIDERLEFEPFLEGSLAVCGFGRRARGPSPLEPDFMPYVPPPAAR
jgi:putative peptide maturation dehydrogenase